MGGVPPEAVKEARDALRAKLLEPRPWTATMTRQQYVDNSEMIDKYKKDHPEMNVDIVG